MQLPRIPSHRDPRARTGMFPEHPRVSPQEECFLSLETAQGPTAKSLPGVTL